MADETDFVAMDKLFAGESETAEKSNHGGESDDKIDSANETLEKLNDQVGYMTEHAKEMQEYIDKTVEYRNKKKRNVGTRRDTGGGWLY